MKTIIKSFFIVATALFVVACGGGGTTGGVEKNELFPSNSRLASPTDDNALKVIAVSYTHLTLPTKA